MDSAEFKSAASSAIDQIVDYYDTVDQRPTISQVQPGYLQNLLPDAAPENGEAWTDIQKDIETKIIPGVTHWQSPNFMAYFPCNSSFPGMLGELYSAAFNAPAFNWICSPAVTELETIVLDWMAKAWNLPECYLSKSEGGGTIAGTASEAVVTVMVAARDRYLREVTKHIVNETERENAFYERRVRLVALGSEMAHSSTQKGAQIAGVRYRSVAVDEAGGWAMQGIKLREVVEKCLAEGLEPFFLTAMLGTTTTCAVDDLEGIAGVIKDHPSIWVHVDAAYVGAALVCPEYQHLTKFLHHFDSYDTNMHKWLLTNFDASCLYVKKRKNLTDSLSILPSYLRNPASDSGMVIDYRDWAIPLGRRFRALKIWFVARTYGISGMQAFIRNHIKLGEEFADWIRSRSDLFMLVSEPAFALTVFAIHAPSTHSGDTDGTSLVADSNRVTQEAYEKINAEGKIFLTSSMLGRRYIIRVVSANSKTDRAHLRNAFDIIVAAAESARKALSSSARDAT